MRKKILLLLKKSGGLSIEELSKNLKITPMGVRQHLMALEKKGLVEYHTVRQGVGRPSFIYILSEKSDRFFPKNYDKFALEILKSIEEKDGRNEISELFRWRKNKIFSQKKQLFNGRKPLSERISVIFDQLNADGYITELADNKKEYTLRQYNCPIAMISKNYPEVCKYELELYKNLLGNSVKRTQCLAHGGHACEYVIPKGKNPSQ